MLRTESHKGEIESTEAILVIVDGRAAMKLFRHRIAISLMCGVVDSESSRRTSMIPLASSRGGKECRISSVARLSNSHSSESAASFTVLSPERSERRSLSIVTTGACESYRDRIARTVDDEDDGDAHRGDPTIPPKFVTGASGTFGKRFTVLAKSV
mmetsp:Transcript_20601/g.50540  ORF Transcript_20601/g.50540 Transcript_20601/m.50540 type:complete len:156 (-) Transcript_20601:244-711(-)